MSVLAVVGGTLLDGNGGEPIENSVLLIEGKRIVAVGDHSLRAPAHATTIRAAGKYIVPGLMDANVHLVLDIPPLTLIRYEGRYDELALEAAQTTLRNGVTTVFDSWGPREYLIKARDAVNDRRVTASRIYLAGNIVGLGGPYSEDFFPQGKAVLFDYASRINAAWQENVGPELMWMAAEQVREEVRRYVQRGIDFLKYAVTGHRPSTLQYIQFSLRVQQAIIEEARRAGIIVQTHTTSVEGLRLAVDLGVDLLQHADLTGPQPMTAETAELIAERRIPCALLANTDDTLEWYREKARTDANLQRYVVADTNQRTLLHAGAVVLLSTDGGVFSSNTLQSSIWKNHAPPHNSLLNLGEGHFVWLRAAEQKRMKPMDALMAATRNIARAYRVDRDLGTLEKGKIADLVILDENPLASASHYRSIHMVMKEGEVVDLSGLPARRLLTQAETET